MKQPYDIIFIGWLFLVNLFLDSYLIFANPQYALKIFGTHFTGWAGWAVKIQSPVLHGLLGFGFIKQKRWSYFLYMAYAALGLSNALSNLYLLGYGQIRMVFIISLLIITIYIYFRRKVFNA